MPKFFFLDRGGVAALRCPQCPGGLRDSFHKKPGKAEMMLNNSLHCVGYCAKGFGLPEVREFTSTLLHKHRNTHTCLYLEGTLKT